MLVELITLDGHSYGLLSLPVDIGVPVIVIWSDRYFVLDADGRYVEAVSVYNAVEAELE